DLIVSSCTRVRTGIPYRRICFPQKEGHTMRRVVVIVLSALMVAVTGCATTQLKFTSLRQLKSEPDIYNQQVLENLSRIALTPSSLAYFSIIDSAIPQVTDIGSASGFLDFPAQSVVKQLHRQ